MSTFLHSTFDRQWEARIWSCNLRANERPRKNIWGGDMHTNIHTCRHFNTVNQPGLRAGSIEKLTHSIKLDLPSCPLIPLIFIKRYTRSFIFVTFCQRISNSLIYLWTNFLEVHGRPLQNIALQHPKKKTPH